MPFCARESSTLSCATSLPHFCRHSTLLSGNTPTYAAIPSESVRKAIREVPQNIGNLARMAVGKLAKAAEKKTALTPVSTASLHRVLCARSHPTYRGLERLNVYAFARAWCACQQNEQEGVLSASACLSRLLPILFESEHEHKEHILKSSLHSDLT